MRKRISLYGLHILGWLAFLILPPLLEVRGSANLMQIAQSRHDVQSLMTYVLIILFSYLNYLLLVPKFYLKRTYGQYALIVAACVLMIVSVPYWSEPLVRLMPPPKFARSPDQGPLPTEFGDNIPPPPVHGELTQTILLLIVSVFASIAVQTNNRLQQIENEKLNAELLQLKAQIHPHFLFNTLNSIYALAIRKDDRTAETIVKLSDFMRYIIRDAHQHTVSLAKEVGYIDNYLDLQHARLQDSVQVDYAQEGNLAGKQIAPLLLFAFIENAFKHGVNPDQESLIQIRLAVRGNDLHLHVFNKKVKTNPLETSHGIGMQNTKERLRLLYPATHQLVIDDTPSHFAVDLTLAFS